MKERAKEHGLTFPEEPPGSGTKCGMEPRQGMGTRKGGIGPEMDVTNDVGMRFHVFRCQAWSQTSESAP
jgi:hypothetical protein